MTELLASSLRLATPLIFAAMGGFLCERSGVATICLEGVMLVAAFFSAVTTYYSHDPYMGLLAGMAAGAMLMLLHGVLCLTARADSIISGVAINLLAAGVTPLLCKSLFGNSTNSASIPLAERFHNVALPGLSQIPVLGPVFFDQPGLVYFALVLPWLLFVLLKKTYLGIRLTASGDNPEALETCGVSPIRVRYLALFTGGLLTSLGGVYLSTTHASQFIRDMTAGRGFIALAAVIIGKWKPLPSFFICLMFGFMDALQIRLQSIEVGGHMIPVQFIQALPYVISLLVLIGVGRSTAPLSIGKSYP